MAIPHEQDPQKETMSFRDRIRTTAERISARTIATALALLLAFGLGFLAGSLREPPDSTFHDIIVNDPGDLLTLITPNDKRVRALVDILQTPENAYAYVRDHVGFDPSLPSLPAGDIIDAGKASCLGKAALLCALYRSMGIPASDVRVVTGELAYPGGIIDHAWVDLEYEGVCLQQDATDLIGSFRFDEFKGTLYTRSFIRKEGYAFNDLDFVIISQLNQLKGMGHPPVR